MIPPEPLLGQPSRWRLVRAMALLALCTIGAAWTSGYLPFGRSIRPIAQGDAIATLSSSRDHSQRELALGALARQAREILDAIGCVVDDGDAKIAEYATVHLRNLERRAMEAQRSGR